MQSYRSPRSFNDFIRIMSLLPTRTHWKPTQRQRWLVSNAAEVATYCQHPDQALIIFRNIFNPDDVLEFIKNHQEQLLQFCKDPEYLAAVLQHVAVFAHMRQEASSENHYPGNELQNAYEYIDALTPFINTIANIETLITVLKKMTYDEAKFRQYAMTYPASSTDNIDIEYDLINIKKYIPTFINHFRFLIIQKKMILIHSLADLANAAELVNKNNVITLIDEAQKNINAQDERWGCRLAIMQAAKHNSFFKQVPKDILKKIFDYLGLGPESYIHYYYRYFKPINSDNNRIDHSGDDLNASGNAHHNINNNNNR